MFDIGFAELIIIGVVSLLVIGPERLPGTIRMVSLWLGRLRRGFNDIKQEVQQELHNDAVMQELRKAGEELKQGTDSLNRDMRSISKTINQPLDSAGPAAKADAQTQAATGAHTEPRSGPQTQAEAETGTESGTETGTPRTKPQ